MQSNDEEGRMAERSPRMPICASDPVIEETHATDSLIADPKRLNFYPLALSRPIFELRCGMTSLGDKLVAKLRPADVACFVPPYMADVYRAKTDRPVNDVASARGDDLLLVNGRVKAAELRPGRRRAQPGGPRRRRRGALRPRRQADLGKLKTDSLDALLDSAKAALPRPPGAAGRVELHLGPGAGQSGATGGGLPRRRPQRHRRHGRGARAPSAAAARTSTSPPARWSIPMVVIDAEHGPVYLDEGVEVHPFTRIEGPVLRRQEVDPAGHQVPRGELDRPDVPRGRRGRGVDHPRLLEQVPRRLPRPRLRGRVGEPRRADDQQRPEERLFAASRWSSTAARPSAPARPRSAR